MWKITNRAKPLIMDDRDQILALSAVVQAADLVDRFANTGRLERADTERFALNINALFVFDAASAHGVLPHPQHLQLALLATYQLLAKPNAMPRSIISYVIAILKLQRRISGNAPVVASLRQALTKVAMYRDADAISTTTISKLGHIYLTHCGAQSRHPSVMVHGKAEYLQRPHIQDSIRATLLSGLRCAMLWRQAGGSMWRGLLYRKRYIRTLDAMIDSQP